MVIFGITTSVILFTKVQQRMVKVFTKYAKTLLTLQKVVQLKIFNLFRNIQNDLSKTEF